MKKNIITIFKEIDKLTLLIRIYRKHLIGIAEIVPCTLNVNITVSENARIAKAHEYKTLLFQELTALKMICPPQVKIIVPNVTNFIKSELIKLKSPSDFTKHELENLNKQYSIDNLIYYERGISDAQLLQFKKNRMPLIDSIKKIYSIRKKSFLDYIHVEKSVLKKAYGSFEELASQYLVESKEAAPNIKDKNFKNLRSILNSKYSSSFRNNLNNELKNIEAQERYFNPLNLKIEDFFDMSNIDNISFSDVPTVESLVIDPLKIKQEILPCPPTFNMPAEPESKADKTFYTWDHTQGKLIAYAWLNYIKPEPCNKQNENNSTDLTCKEKISF